ncbi:MAG: hypothetical protein PHY80_00710 [Rickettsiales bacterium]|nr:hypothetical protein [Rickettsiales bacterium]
MSDTVLTFTAGISLRRAEEMLGFNDADELVEKAKNEDFSIDDLIVIVELASLGNVYAQNAILKIEKAKISKMILSKGVPETFFERLSLLEKKKKGTEYGKQINKLICDLLLDYEFNPSNESKYGFPNLKNLIDDYEKDILDIIVEYQKNNQRNTTRFLENLFVVNTLLKSEKILQDKNWQDCFKTELKRGNPTLFNGLLAITPRPTWLDDGFLSECLADTRCQFGGLKKQLILAAIQEQKDKGKELVLTNSQKSKIVNLILPKLGAEGNAKYSNLLCYEVILVIMNSKTNLESYIKSFRERGYSESEILEGTMLQDIIKLSEDIPHGNTFDNIINIATQIIRFSNNNYNIPVKLDEFERKSMDKPKPVVAIIEENAKIIRALTLRLDEIVEKIEKTEDLSSNPEMLPTKLEIDTEKVNVFIDGLIAKTKDSDIKISTEAKINLKNIIQTLSENISNGKVRILLNRIFDNFKTEQDYSNYVFPLPLSSEEQVDYLNFVIQKIGNIENVPIRSNLIRNQLKIKNQFPMVFNFNKKPTEETKKRRNDFIAGLIEIGKLENDETLKYLYFKAKFERELLNGGIGINDFRSLNEIITQHIKTLDDNNKLTEYVVSIFNMMDLEGLYSSAINFALNIELRNRKGGEIAEKLRIVRNILKSKTDRKREEIEVLKSLNSLLEDSKKADIKVGGTEFDEAIQLFNEYKGKKIVIKDPNILLYYEAISEFINSNEDLQGHDLLVKTQGQDLGFIIDTDPRIYVKYANDEEKKKEYEDFEDIARLSGGVSVKATTFNTKKSGLFFYSQATSRSCRDLSRIILGEPRDSEEERINKETFKESLVLNVAMSAILGIYDTRADNISTDLETGECRIIDFSEYPDQYRFLNVIHFNFEGTRTFKEAFLKFIIDGNNKMENEGSLENDGTIDFISRLLGSNDEEIKKFACDIFRKIKETIIKDFEVLEELKKTNPAAYIKSLKKLKIAITRYNEIIFLFNEHYHLNAENIFPELPEKTTIRVEKASSAVVDTIVQQEFDRKFSALLTDLDSQTINGFSKAYGEPAIAVDEETSVATEVKITLTFEKSEKERFKKVITVSGGDGVHARVSHIRESFRLAADKKDKKSSKDVVISDLSEEFRNDDKFLTTYNVLEEKIIGDMRYLRLKASTDPELVFDFTIPASMPVVNFITLSREKGMINAIDILNVEKEKVEIRYFTEGGADIQKSLMIKINGGFIPNLERISLILQKSEKGLEEPIEISKRSAISRFLRHGKGLTDSERQELRDSTVVCSG